MAMIESQLQSQICKLLDRLGIVYIRSRTDRRTTTTRGAPDFIFAARGIISHTSRGTNVTLPRACAWEIKLPGKKPRSDQKHQRDFAQKMMTPPNVWKYSVITSIAEAEAELKAMGIIS